MNADVPTEQIGSLLSVVNIEEKFLALLEMTTVPMWSRQPARSFRAIARAARLTSGIALS
jgi:hypothetical protein